MSFLQHCHYCGTAIPSIICSLWINFQAENTLQCFRMNFEVRLLLRQLANTGKATQINTAKASNGYGTTQNQFRMRFHYSFFIIHLMHLWAAAKRDIPALPPYTRQEFLPLPPAPGRWPGSNVASQSCLLSRQHCFIVVSTWISELTEENAPSAPCVLPFFLNLSSIKTLFEIRLQETAFVGRASSWFNHRADKVHDATSWYAGKGKSTTALPEGPALSFQTFHLIKIKCI